MGASMGVALTGTELLNQAAARATPTLLSNGSQGIEHVVVPLPLSFRTCVPFGEI